MMEKQTTCKSRKIRVAAMIMMLGFMSAFAQNLQTTLGESWNGTSWENAFISQNTYNGSDHLIGTISQVWTVPPGQWDNAIRYAYINNPNGAATQILIEIWDDDGNTWMLSQRVTNTLNGSDQILTSISEIWIGTEWINISKQTNTYGGGYLTSTLLESWDFLTSEWTNSNLTNYTNNPDGSVNQAVSQTWNPVGSNWLNATRSNYTYNGAGNVVTELGELWVADNWVNDSRTTYSYDGGWLSASLSENWLTASSTWENDTQSLHTNNANGTPAQIVVQDWNPGASVWENTARITYTYEGLGVDDSTKNAFVLYPNPTQDFINVKSDVDYLNPYAIYDQHGRTVQNGILSDFETSVDVSGLSSGIYFFKIGDSRKKVARLIKE